jgi:hypothetical protein
MSLYQGSLNPFFPYLTTSPVILIAQSFVEHPLYRINITAIGVNQVGTTPGPLTNEAVRLWLTLIARTAASHPLVLDKFQFKKEIKDKKNVI